MRVCDVSVGDRHEATVVHELSRTQIVMYAGASGDYNPLHTDEVYATQVAGYPSVIAHGQLTMGLTAKVVTDWITDGELTAFGVRFARQVWPGDTLIARATVTAVAFGENDCMTVELDVSTVNSEGDTVVAGYARLRERKHCGG